MAEYVTLKCYSCGVKVPHHVPSPVTDACPGCGSDYFEIVEVDV